MPNLCIPGGSVRGNSLGSVVMSVKRMRTRTRTKSMVRIDALEELVPLLVVPAAGDGRFEQSVDEGRGLVLVRMVASDMHR